MSPGRCRAVTWTNVWILLVGPLGTNFSEMLIEIHTFSFKKIHLKMSSGKCRPFCLVLNVLIQLTKGEWAQLWKSFRLIYLAWFFYQFNTKYFQAILNCGTFGSWKTLQLHISQLVLTLYQCLVMNIASCYKAQWCHEQLTKCSQYFSQQVVRQNRPCENINGIGQEPNFNHTTFIDKKVYWKLYIDKVLWLYCPTPCSSKIHYLPLYFPIQQ